MTREEIKKTLMIERLMSIHAYEELMDIRVKVHFNLCNFYHRF